MAVEVNYIDTLPLPPMVRDQLRLLDAPSPFALLSLIAAARGPFENQFGRRVTEQVFEFLLPQLTALQQRELQQGASRFSTGAILEQRHFLSPPSMDFDQREVLFGKIEALRHDDPQRHRFEIEKLEREIAALYTASAS